MKIVNLSENNTILNRFIAEIRDVNIQQDSLRFRRNIERIGEIMAYEDYEIVMGLEVHSELKTNTKIFSSMMA